MNKKIDPESCQIFHRFLDRFFVDFSFKNISNIYQKATTYLAMSKKGTNQALVNKLKFAADSFKQSEQYRALYSKWLEAYSKKTSLNMFEQDGVIVLGQLE